MFPYPILFEANTPDYSNYIPILFVLLVFILPIWACVMVRCYDSLVEWWEDLFGPVYYDDKSYNTGNTTKTTTTKTTKPKTTWGKKADKWGLYDDDRQEPPRATFFERVDGVERSEDGPWEEIYLNARELTGWENKKRQKAVVTDLNNTKSKVLDESRAFQEQYTEVNGYRG